MNLSRQKRLEDFIGIVVAAYVVVIGAAVLSHIVLVREEKKRPEPMKVLVEAAPEPPPPVEEPPTEVEQDNPLDVPPPPDVAATRRDSTEEGELLLDPVAGETREADDAVFEEQTLAPPTSIQEWVPTTEEMAEIRSIQEEVREETEALDERKLAIADKLIRMEVKSAARQFELDSDGGLEGAIRLFDVEGFPDAVVKKVLDRYNIAYERRYVKAMPGRSFLNAASTADGKFTNRPAEGYYNVMVFPAKTLSMLSTKETSALMDRGYEPRNSRIRKITFGIVKDIHNEFDLGVVDLEVERIR